MSQQRSTARDIAQIAVFAAITAALGLLPVIVLPISPVPITAQSFGVILAGAVLGARRGGLSQLLFIALVALGLPLLAGGRGGIGVFASPTVGFLIGFPVVAFLIGWLTERFVLPYSLVKGLLVNLIGGIVVMYVLGWTGMLLRTHLSARAAFLALSPFIIGDAVKVVVATVVAQGVHKALPELLRRARQRTGLAA